MNDRPNKSFLRRLRTIVKGDTDFDFSNLEEKPKEEEPKIKHVAGRQIISREEAERRAAEYLLNEVGIGWGGIKIPDKTHFLFVGQTRSGKSLLIKLLTQQIFSLFGKGTNQRAVIYDASTELIPFLYALVGDRIPIYIFDPEDARCTAWKISEDIRTKDEALNLGKFIFPVGNGQGSKDEYFTEGPATVMAAVMDAFLLTNQERMEKGEEPIEWNLRDVRLALSNEQNAKELLGRWPETREKLKYFESSNPDLDRTLINKFDRLDTTAARWHHSTTREKRKALSLREFLGSKDSAILIIGGSSDVTIKAINHVIFEQLAALMLDKSVPSETDSRTWLLLDEFSDIGKMETMGKLLSMGLKKGVRIVAAYQNIASVEKVYGAYDPAIIKSETATIAFLRQQGDTAKNASAFIGERDIERLKVSTGSSQTIGAFHMTTSKNVEYVPDKEPVVSPHELGDLPVSGDKNGVSAYFLTHYVRDIFRHQFTWDELSFLANLKSDEPNFVPNKSKEAQRIEQWSEEERKQWGLSSQGTLPKEPRQDEGNVPPSMPENKEFDIDEILDSLRNRGR